MSKPTPIKARIANGVRHAVRMVLPPPAPTREDLRSYWDFVVEVAASEFREHPTFTRSEIEAILKAAGKSPADLSRDFDRLRPDAADDYRSRRY